jgi:hypothetical protein
MRKVTFCLAVIALVGASSYAAAQGHRPGAASGVGRAGPSVSGAPGGFGLGGFGAQSQSQPHRQDAPHRLEAEQRREDGQAHNRSAEQRAEHAPNEHAADEARLADQNKTNKDRRAERRELKGENRGTHGKR